MHGVELVMEINRASSGRRHKHIALKLLQRGQGQLQRTTTSNVSSRR